MKSEYEAKDFSFTYFESLYYNRTGKRIDEKDYLSFGLKTKDGFLTNAGALFTDVCPFFHSRVFCTRWNGLTKAPSSFDAIDDKEYSGSILQLLNDGENFIKLYNQKIWYKLPTSRVEKENFPERAIHEAMVNALVHRDYGVIGSEIHIDIFDDRIIIQNPGGMYDGIPVKDQELENVVSTRRNPVIADLLTRMDFMERRGSGFRKILDAVKFSPNYTKENLPIFNSNPYSFSVTFKNMNYGVEPVNNDTPTVTHTVTPTVTHTVEERKKLSKEDKITYILEFCSTPKSRTEIMAEFGFRDKVSFLDTYIKPLINAGKLSYTQPDKPNSATQKYVTLNN